MTVGISGAVLARQFARAVLADRMISEELTRLALAKIGEAGRIEPDNPTELLKAFFSAWRESAANPGGAPFSDRALLSSISPPPSEDRLMVLLVDVLGFSPREAAKIVSPGSTDPEPSLARGRAAISQARKATAIIIEDEPLIAAELRSILEAMGITVAGLAKTAEGAVRIAKDILPDLVLADYNLEEEKSGSDAVEIIREHHDCRVVFITGYPEKVLQGDMAEPDFVIAKPYRINAVRAAVAQCLDSMLTGATP